MFCFVLFKFVYLLQNTTKLLVLHLAVFSITLLSIYLLCWWPDKITIIFHYKFGSIFSRHIHGKHRKRDTTKCFNQREITRKRDRQTGLHDVHYRITDVKNMTIADAPLTVINIELFCNYTVTPWCDCSKTDDDKVKPSHWRR